MAAPDQWIGPLEHVGPWTEEEFLALPIDHRVELIDGSLLVSPSGSHRHQRLGFRICAALDAAAPSGWEVLESPNIRLSPGSILIPDVAVLENPDMDATVSDVRALRLAVEVVSPGNASADRVRKPRLYAQAGVPTYLRVEQAGEGPVGHLHVLDRGRYQEVSAGPKITLEAPFAVTFDLARLMR